MGRCFCGSQRKEGEEWVTGEMCGVVMQVFRQCIEGSQVSGQVHGTIQGEYLLCIYWYMVFLSGKTALCILSLTFW